MKNDELDQLLRSVNLDVAEPEAGHRERFKKRLEANLVGSRKGGKLFSLWPPMMSIAAILMVALMLFPNFLSFNETQKRDLGSVSAEMKNTQNFYTAVLQQELQNLQGMRTPKTERMIRDALQQMETLERDYELLKTDLVKSGNDQRVIYAMVANFQQRMDLLNKLLEKAQNINAHKPSGHENDYL